MSINRRRFCQSTVAGSLASTLPAGGILAQAFNSSRNIPAEIPAVTLDGTATSIEGAAVRELGESLRGSLLLSGDPGYDSSRTIWNGMHDRFPALVVRGATKQDVSNAVTFASERGLLLSVKGGGHSWPGRSVADNAMMIDLGEFHDVSVDVAGRRMRSGGGALLYNLDAAAQEHGLITPAGVVSHTGVGGLTLGGGYGRLNRKFGLTIDNLVSAQIVTADGQIRNVSADENADLFWAIRGGGGNFGVVTEFEFQLHEAGPDMLGGDIMWPVTQARDVLEFFAEYAMSLSNEMYIGIYMTTLPEGDGVVAADVCYCGDLEAGERELAPLRQIGNPVADTVASTRYLALQTRWDGVWHHGIRSYIKGGMVKERTQGLIDTMIDAFEPGSGVGIGGHTAGGAVARVDETATAWPHRNAVSTINAHSVWTDPAEDDVLRTKTKAVWAALEPHTGGYYDNIQSEVSGVSDNFGPAYDRLVSVKNTYDPTNQFRLNSNIRPTV